MSRKEISLITFLIISMIVMTGCGSKKASSTDQKNSDSSAKVVKPHDKKTSSSSSNKKEATLWNTNKDNKLKTFINQWAPTMNQKYTKYDGVHSIQTSTGTTYPDGLSNVTVEGSQDSIGWSKNGEGNNDYNIVAIYNYDGTQPPVPNHITYFFAFHNGKPVALVDQSRDGTPNLTETKNTNVKSAFEEIATGKSATVDTSQSESTSSKSNNEEPTKVDFPSDFQGTWYGYPASSPLTTVTIQGNRMSLSNGSVTELHNGKQRSVADKAVASGKGTINHDHGNWMLINGKITARGLNWINILGWYQGAGAGTFYAVTTDNVSGKQVPVLVAAGGAQISPYARYYPTKADANAMKASDIKLYKSFN